MLLELSTRGCLLKVVSELSERAGFCHRSPLTISATIVGSGGFMNDLVFYGGMNGVLFGNQQYTVRNLTFCELSLSNSGLHTDQV
jgi:hypothetical protein